MAQRLFSAPRPNYRPRWQVLELVAFVFLMALRAPLDRGTQVTHDILDEIH